MARVVKQIAGVAVLAFIAGGLLTACAPGDDQGGGPPTGGIAVGVVWPSATQPSNTQTAALSATDPSIRAAAPAGVFSLVATVSGPGMADVSAGTDTTPGESGTFNVDNVPVGANRSLTLQGYSQAAGEGNLLYEGTTTGISVAVGVNAEVTVAVTPNPAVLPGAPGSLTATAGNTQVTLNWSAPNSGAAVTGYKVFRALASGVSVTGTPLAAGVAATTFQDTGLTNGTAYFYRVAGTSADGDGPPSAEANATPTATAAATFSVGGDVSGLTGGTLVLQNNGGDDRSITADGAFAFATELADGGAYEVTVLTQPTAQTCTVSGGTGTISGTDVTSVGVACAGSGAPTVTGTNPSDGASGVALNTAMTWRRKLRSHKGGQQLPEDVPCPRPLPDDRASHQELVEWLYSEIARWPKVDRSLFLLYLDRVSYREMSEILGISESNVGVKLNRLKKRLAERRKGADNGC